MNESRSRCNWFVLVSRCNDHNEKARLSLRVAPMTFDPGKPDDVCPFTVHSNSGIPNDSLRAAKVNRFLHWRWQNDPAFRAEVTNATREHMAILMERLIYGAPRAKA